MSKKCKAYSASKLGLEAPDTRKAFYAGWDAAIEAAQPAVRDHAALAEQPAEQLSRWVGDDNIESPFNACMYRGYCLSLKSKLRIAEEAAHHRPAPPELEAAVNAALGLDTPTLQQVREFVRNDGSAIVTGHQEYSFTDDRLHKFVLAALKKFAPAPQPAKREPLTDAQICSTLTKAFPDDVEPDGSWKLAQYELDIFRIAERAHGIGEQE